MLIYLLCLKADKSMSQQLFLTKKKTKFKIIIPVTMATKTEIGVKMLI